MFLLQDIFAVLIVSQEFCFFFCYLAFVSSGFFRLECGSKCPVNESELLCGYMAFDLRLFAHSSSSPKKKIHKKVVEYSTDRPSTHLRRKFNWFQLSTFLQEKKLNSLLLSANERSEIFATCRHFDLKSIIWSQSTASHLFARKGSFHRPTSSSLLARWHLMITITSCLHTL